MKCLAILIVLFSTTCRAQILDYYDTVSIRWISVDRNNSNEFLFEKMNDEDTNLLFLIEKASIEQKEVFFLETPELELKTKLYPGIGKKEIFDSLYEKYWFDNLSINSTCLSENCIEVYMDPSKLIKYEDSLDVIVFCEGSFGSLCIVYSPKISFQFSKEDIHKIKIREELKLNTETGRFEYIPVGFTFYPCYNNESKYTIWVDINRLNKLFQTSSSKWYSYFSERKYSGKQYMQRDGF